LVSIRIFLLLQLLETINLKIMAYVINDDCTACGTCIDECPVEAISEGDIYVIDADICTDCGSCADVCPVEAIHPEE
jgi:ferredoxin